MSELISPKTENSINESNIHQFHALNPDTRRSENEVQIVENQAKAYKKSQDNSDSPAIPEKSTVFGATFMLTNICLGTTIFTFAVRAKSFGLVWIIVACILVGVINYWTIMRGVLASSKCKEDDFSEITEKILGKKIRIILNIFLIIYSYACMMCFIALVFPLFGRFIQSAFYPKDYVDFEDFNEKKWGKAYIKYPFFVALAFCLSLMCLIKDINKLNFSAYIGVVAVIYTLFVVMVQCRDYYKYYKETKYVEEDESTHPNWVNLGNAFNKELDFFKGMANLFAAYACHPGIFPVYAGFKFQEDGVKKMRWGTFFATCLTTALHIISIVCSFLTDPYQPEDLIVFRKNKGNGKDVAMVISKLFVSLSLIFTLPGYYFSLRLSIANSFTGGKISNKFNYIFTFLSCFGCAAVAAVYDKILNYLSYIGGFLSVVICYLIPVLLYVLSSGKPVTYWQNILEIILTILLCIIGYLAGIATIIDDVKN